MTDVVIREEIGPDGKAFPKDAKSDEGKRPQAEEYVRRRADGGIWTAPDALKYGLIDALGYQDDAIQKAKDLASLGDNYKAVTYEHKSSLANLLMGGKSEPPKMQLDAIKLAAGATPRLWFLAPQSELAGLLSAIGK
jgi:ClpP class serine protease